MKMYGPGLRERGGGEWRILMDQEINAILSFENIESQEELVGCDM